ncbi:hypothetical protein XENTR_v10019820 [Xenopus tropicalis]|nr:hypothetical protein XENTR_v10019820 [Xenopus tropicalis]
MPPPPPPRPLLGNSATPVIPAPPIPRLHFISDLYTINSLPPLPSYGGPGVKNVPPTVGQKAWCLPHMCPNVCSHKGPGVK